jgi:hypothetical protein
MSGLSAFGQKGSLMVSLNYFNLYGCQLAIADYAGFVAYEECDSEDEEDWDIAEWAAWWRTVRSFEHFIMQPSVIVVASVYIRT